VDAERLTKVASMSKRSEWLEREERETAELKRQALKYGIDIPRKDGWWWDDSEDIINSGVSLQELEYAVSEYLSEQGKAGVRKLIREEARKEDEWQRARFEWKVKMWVSVISAVTGLLGVLIGIFAILRK
jgi:hypothetical protein